MKNSKTINDDLSVRVALELMGRKTHPEKKRRAYRMTEERHSDLEERGRQLKPFQWKKGQTGNPAGRPPNTVSLTAILNRKLVEHPENAEAIVDALIALGMRPNLSQMTAIDKLFERIDGKVIETHRIEGELPVRIIFMPAEQIKIIESTPEPLMLEGEHV